MRGRGKGDKLEQQSYVCLSKFSRPARICSVCSLGTRIRPPPPGTRAGRASSMRATRCDSSTHARTSSSVDVAEKEVRSAPLSVRTIRRAVGPAEAVGGEPGQGKAAAVGRVSVEAGRRTVGGPVTRQTETPLGTRPLYAPDELAAAAGAELALPAARLRASRSTLSSAS